MAYMKFVISALKDCKNDKICNKMVTLLKNITQKLRWIIGEK
jgi:hypothetical protein